jgi:GST-like protein
VTQIEPIILHGVMSPNVIKVAIMLEELELHYELRHVALFAGQQFTPEFLQLNPAGKVPVIEDARLGRPLAESGAILFWLAEQAGKLFPAEGPDRYEVMQWLMVQMASIGPMLGQYTHFRLLAEGSEPYGLGRYGAMAQRLYQLVNDRVADREWIAGDAYSIADIATFPWAEYLERHDLSIETYPAMKRWREKIAERPAVIRAKARVVEAFAAPSVETITAAGQQDLDRFFGRTREMPLQDYAAVKQLG